MPTCDAIRHPDTMTADERRAEVACVLARGLVRAVHDSRARTAQSTDFHADPPPTRP